MYQRINAVIYRSVSIVLCMILGFGFFTNEVIIASAYATYWHIYYDNNGGDGASIPASGDGTVNNYVQVTTHIPTRTGHEFLGWAENPAATEAKYKAGTVSFVQLTSDLTLYAVWTKATTTTYILTYKANGGDGAPKLQTGSNKYTIPDVVPTRLGYIFLGWAISSTASEAEYYAGDDISLEDDLTLYAVWTVQLTGSCGQDGDNIIWSLDVENGLLQLIGNGKMIDYDFLLDRSSTSPWYSQRATIKTIIISEGIEHLGNYSFYDCDRIKSVSIPNTVTSIGIGTFDSSSLESVSIPEGLISIEQFAFARTQLKTVVFPSTLTSIGKYGFYECKQLESIVFPNYVKIDTYAFTSCPLLKNVCYGGEEKKWRYMADPDNGLTSKTVTYHKHTDETETTVEVITSPTCVENGTANVFFSPCGLLKESHAVVPALGHSWDDGVITTLPTYTSEGVRTFTCTRCGETSTEAMAVLETLENHINGECGATGDTVLWDLNTKTGELTIFGKGAMRDFTTSFSDHAPWSSNPSNVCTVIIENGVTNIGDYAFEHCTSLTSVTIPDSVTSIGRYAFYECWSLTSVTIPDSVTDIGDSAFSSCTSLTSITIPGNVTSIGSSAFENCTSLTSVTIPDSVTSIGQQAFMYCTSLTSITIPDSVTSIGDSTFMDCTSLTGVMIGNSVTSIGLQAFMYCTSLTAITVDEHNPAYCSDASGVLFDKDKTTLIQYPAGNFQTAYTIPDSVTCIEHRAFEYCTSLTSVTIPDSVTSIGHGAFKYCTSLTSVTIPDSVTSIGGSAFQSCTSLTAIMVDEQNPVYCSSASGVLFDKDKTTLIQYPAGNFQTAYTIPDSVTSIGDSAFEYCTSLTSVTIPDSVTRIGGYAFKDCTSLTSVTIPDSVTSIGGCAFYDCTSLTSVTIPDSVTNIDDYVFEYCESLTSVTIPDSVTSIEGHAFFGCTSLASITIPCSVTSIGYRAFFGCTSLATVCYDGIQQSDISIGDDNAPLTNAEWFYHKHDEQTPTEVRDAIEATCTSEGKSGDVYYSPCGVLKESGTAISPLGHDYDVAVTEPTCTEGGFTTHTCSLCGDTYTDTPTDALGHDYDAVLTAPTCTKGGCTTYTCSRCKDTYTADETEALGHNFGDWTVTTAPTCTEKGVEIRTCQREGCTASENRDVSALDHDYDAVVTEPTCTEGGYTTYTCSRCGDSYTADETEVLGHDFGEWTVTSTPTCTEKGVETRTCRREGCDAYDTRDVNALNHDWKAEWSKDGVNHWHACMRCDEKNDEAAHVYGAVTYTWEQTRGAWKATAKRTCTVCEWEETETVTATGAKSKEPTCTENGETTYTATFSNTAFETQQKTVADISVLNHDWKTEWSKDGANHWHGCMRCDEKNDEAAHTYGDVSYTWDQVIGAWDATAKRVCTVCEWEETETVTATGAQSKAPTCTVNGETTYTAQFENAAFETQTKTVSDIPASGHNWDTWMPVEKTDTHEHVCFRCGTIETEDHIWSEWTGSETDSAKKRTCERCGLLQHQQKVSDVIIEYNENCYETKTVQLIVDKVNPDYARRQYGQYITDKNDFENPVVVVAYEIHTASKNNTDLDVQPSSNVTVQIPLPDGYTKPNGDLEKAKVVNLVVTHAIPDTSQRTGFRIEPYYHTDYQSNRSLLRYRILPRDGKYYFVFEVTSFSPFIVYEIMNPEISVTQNMDKATLPYGEKRILTANVKDLPDGAKIAWTADNDKLVTLKPSEDGRTCEVQAKKSGNVTIMAKIVDADGKEIKQDGKSVSDSVTLQTKAGFFHKLFFWIFRIPWPFPKK